MAQEMATIAAAQAASEAAKATTETELDFDAVPPPPPTKSSNGCSPDADDKINPSAVEFKN